MSTNPSFTTTTTSALSPSSLNYEEITRNFIVDGNDDSPYYDGSISYCTCHKQYPLNNQTCTTSLCYNYATLTECIKCYSNSCQNNKFTKFYTKKLEIRPVENKGIGLFCLEDITGGEFIKEYVGELVSSKELQRRLKSDSSPHRYVMELKEDTYLDASRKGSISRFINHSCEPNCTVEVWTVGRRLRVGIFSLKDIPAGTELTFDYRWERSTRPPTKCYCGTKSCRGYLEVEEEEENGMEIQEKTGLAVPQIEAYKEALRVNQGGEWLVKRRVKVWWDGNQRYFDADVLDYDPVKGIHTIQYLEDGQISKEILALNKQQVREKYSPWLDMKEENISGCVGAQCKSLVEPESSVEAPQMATNGVELVSSKDSNGTVSVKPVWDWLWLDESRKDLMIKKKSDSELREADDLPLNDNETSQNIKEDTSKVPMPSFTRPSSSPTAKIPAKLSADICRYILDQHEICYGDADFRGLIRLLTDLMKSQYETYIRLKLHVDSPEDELPVMLYGPSEKVHETAKLIEYAMEHVKIVKTSNSRNLHSIILHNQPRIFTSDWRRNISQESMRHLSLLAQNIGISIPLTELFVDSYTSLSLVPTSMTSTGSSYSTEDAVLRTTRTSLVSLCKIVNTTYRIELHALILLQRCFDLFPSTTIGSDILSLVCVCLLLSMKSNGVFKPKHLTIVIIEAYPLIFDQKFPQDISSTNNTLPFYRDRVLEMEKKVYKRLFCDLFIPDITYLPLIFNKQEVEVKVEDIEIIKELTTYVSTLLYRYGSKTIEIFPSPPPTTTSSTSSSNNYILCHETLKTLPFDLIQWSSSLILCILSVFLHDYYTSPNTSTTKHIERQSLPPLEDRIILDILISITPSSVFILYYQNSLAYYPSALRYPVANCLIWGVTLISHLMLSLLSLSDIRYISNSFYPLKLLSRSHKKSYNAFGTQQQWKFIMSHIPRLFLRWIETIPSHPSPRKPRLKTRSLYLINKKNFHAEKISLEDFLKDFRLSVDEYNGWMSGTQMSRIFIEDRVPIFVPTTNDNNNLPTTNKNTEKNSKLDEISSSKNTPPPDVPSSDGTIYGNCSLEELNEVNYHHDESNKIPLFALIPSPSIKTQLRELKKYHQYNSSSSSSSSSLPSSSPSLSQNTSKYISSAYGISSLCIAEITMFQYLHYFQRIDESPSYDYFEGLACPIAIVYDHVMNRQTHESLYYNHIVRREKMEEANSSTSSTTTATATSAISSDEHDIADPSQSDSSTSNVIQLEDTSTDSILQLLSTHRQTPTVAAASAVATATHHSSSPVRSADSTSNNNRRQSDILSDVPSPSLLTYLYGLYPATQCHIPLNSVLPFLHHSGICSSGFLHDLSKQLIDIFYYCYRKGLVFKYIPYDYLHISTHGRLILNSLQGATFLSCSGSGGGSGGGGNSHSHTSPSTTTTTTTTTSPFGPYLSVTSPEVIYGSIPNESSTIWSVMAVCYSLFTGSLPIKLCSMDTKRYLQHLLALLGTPGTNKNTFSYYNSLPYAEDYGIHIVDRQTGKLIEVRNRLEKLLKTNLSKDLLDSFSVINPRYEYHDSRTTSTDTGTTSTGSSSTNTSSLEMIFLQTLQLDPIKRPSFEKLLQMPFFLYQFPSEFSDNMMDVGNLLTHLRTQEELNIKYLSIEDEVKQLKRKEVDDLLMCEVYGNNWNQQYQIFKERKMKPTTSTSNEQRIEKINEKRKTEYVNTSDGSHGRFENYSEKKKLRKSFDSNEIYFKETIKRTKSNEFLSHSPSTSKIIEKSERHSSIISHGSSHSKLSSRHSYSGYPSSTSTRNSDRIIPNYHNN